MNRKTTTNARLSDAPVGALVPMPHGGALRNGGTNRGGSGRPPNVIRARSRAMFDLVLDEMERRNLKKATLGELATLANTAGRYGLGTADAVDLTSKGDRLPGVIILPAEIPDDPATDSCR